MMLQRSSGLVQYSLIIAMIAIVFVYFQTRTIDVEQHNRRVDLLLQLKQAEGKLDRDILQVTSFLLVQYDPFVETTHEIKSLSEKILIDDLSIGEVDYHLIIDKYLASLKDKFELLERIKSKAALVRNGLHYLPVLIDNVKSEDILIGDELSQILNHIYHYYILPSELDTLTIINEINDFRNAYNVDKSENSMIKDTIFHMEANLQLSHELLLLRDNYMTIPSDKRFDELYDYYNNYYAEKSRIAEIFSLTIVLFTVALLIGLGFAINRIIRERNRSEYSHNQLVDAVNSLSEAFALFSSTGELILYNYRFIEFYPWINKRLKNGLTLHEFSRLNHDNGLVSENVNDDLQANVTDMNSLSRTSHIEHLVDGRWYLASDSKTTSGELVCVRVDITDTKESEIELRKLYRALEQSPVTVMITDTQGTIEYVNPKFVETTGYTEDEAIGQKPSILKSGNMEDEDYKELWETISSGNTWSGEFQNRKKDGTVYFESTSISPVRDTSGNIINYISIKEDITTRKKVEDQLRMNATVFETASEGIVITDTNNVIKTVNPAFTRITGYGLDEVIGKTPAILNSGLHDDEFYKELWSSLNSKGYWNGEIWNRRKDSAIYPEWLSIAAIKDESGDVQEYVAVFSDITRRKQDEEQIRHQANFDALTKLPNRSLLVDRLSQAIVSAKRLSHKVALLFIDLDRFKSVNDSLGHVTGDELLKQVAKRIGECVSESDTVARFGGDEFVIVLPDIVKANEAADVAQRVISAIDQSYRIFGREIYVGASIGITIYPDDSHDSNTMLRNADMAMYRAKEAGRNNYQYYTSLMNEQAQRRMELERDLRKAVDNNDFFLVYQPIISIKTGDIIAVEALVRWQHPRKGVIGSDIFIPVAEETGLIGTLGRWILKEACLQVSDWKSQGLDIKVNVNISSRQLTLGLETSEINDIIKKSGISSSLLMLEITEGFLLDGTRPTMKWLNEIKKMGIGLAIDDFGTGYSSLGYLKRYPMDTLKIDRSFINDILDDKGDASLVEAIISMSHSLGLDVVAEGVENEGQLELLKQLGCDKAQGFLIGKPVRPEEIDLPKAINM